MAKDNDHLDDPDYGVPTDLVLERDRLSKRLREVNYEITRYRREMLTEEPKCPECDVGVLRPKCMYELGSHCPRHDVINFYGGADVLREMFRDK